LTAIAWAATGLALLVMALRFASAVSFGEPLTGITSGAEEETALSLWRYVKGLDVYLDPHRIPFAAAVYNWLFYALYGETVGLVLRVLALPDVWLLTISRFVTMAWAVAGAIVAFYVLRRAAGSSQLLRLLAAPFAVYLFFGPLVGFWAMSLNMDVAATACTAAAALVFCARYDKAPLQAIVYASILSYLAWSFKQPYVFAAGALVLFLLLRRDWLGFAVASTIHLVGWSVALAIGTEIYFKIMFFIGIDATMAWWQLWRNLQNAAVKITPTLGAAIAALAAWRGGAWRAIRDDTTLLFALCGLFVSAALILPFSAKIGASENYYFALVFFLTFAAVAAGARIAWTKTTMSLLALGWALAAIASLLVLTGNRGVISVRASHELHLAQQKCLKDLPQPVFPTDTYLTLPWMTDSEPRFLLVFPYRFDRAAGRAFERDGVGGLIRERYFAALVIGAGGAPEFDGARFDGYERRVANCAGLDINYRKPGK
jgi:hypothetical protein